MGGPQSRSGRGGEEINSQPLPRLEPPIIQPASQHYTTELSGLLPLEVLSEFQLTFLFGVYIENIVRIYLYSVLVELYKKLK
jgi:hypothetical protein